MGFDTHGTKLANLVDPQVLTDYVDAKLVNAIKFAPLAVVDTTLQGRAGDTITIPVYAYIGDAADVAEGADIAISQLTATTIPVTVKKVGKAIQISDEAVLSAYGDPIQECGDQLVLSIASKIDNDFLTTLGTVAAGMTYTNAATTHKLTAAAVQQALVKFGEDFDGPKVLFVAPQQHADLITEESWVPATDLGVEKILSGVVGMIAGCQVVVTNKIVVSETAGWTNYIVKPGALGLLLKRDTMVESDRDIINKSTVISADKHYVTYLKDSSKAIKITTALS